jgi:hypothetical protein
MVEKMEKHENYDEIWLSEMPTPVTFVKNLLIWVDDIPTNNAEMVKDLD